MNAKEKAIAKLQSKYLAADAAVNQANANLHNAEVKVRSACYAFGHAKDLLIAAAADLCPNQIVEFQFHGYRMKIWDGEIQWERSKPNGCYPTVGKTFVASP